MLLASSNKINSLQSHSTPIKTDVLLFITNVNLIIIDQSVEK